METTTRRQWWWKWRASEEQTHRLKIIETTIQKRREISFLQIIGLYTSWKLYMYWNSSTVYNLHCTAAITKIQYAPAVVPASSLVSAAMHYLLLSKQTMRELLSARALQQESPHTLPHVARANARAPTNSDDVHSAYQSMFGLDGADNVAFWFFYVYT